MKCKIAVYACHAFTDIEYQREREKRTHFPQEILEIQRPLNKKKRKLGLQKHVFALFPFTVSIPHLHSTVLLQEKPFFKV